MRRSDFGFDDQHSLNVQRRRLSLDTIRAWNVFESDDSSDNDDKGTEEGWQDAITGIRGMAQALCDANNSVATVSLNADLTVSLSNLMLNTLKLFDPTGEKSGSERVHTFFTMAGTARRMPGFSNSRTPTPW